MTLAALAGGGSVFVLLLLLACPLAMLFMMRGGYGHGSMGGHHHSHGTRPTDATLDELRRERASLDAEIERLEQTEGEGAVGTSDPVPSGR